MATTTRTIQGRRYIDMMTEEVLVWFLLVYGFWANKPESLIGAGLFAVACNLKQMWKIVEDRKGDT